MDALSIGVIIFCAIMFIGALVFGHYGSKVSEEIEREIRNKYPKK